MMKLTTEEAYRRCPDMVKGQTYQGRTKSYRFYCDKHGVYIQQFGVHDLMGCRCPKCGREKTADACTLTIKEAEKRAPDMVKGQMWVGGHASYKFFCEEHGVYFQALNNHCYADGRPKKRCWRCSGGKPLNKTEAENLCPDMEKGQKWSGAEYFYWFVCKTHGRRFEKFRYHKNRRFCCSLGGRESGYKGRLLKIQDAELRCPDMEKGQIWTGVHTKYRFFCEEHGCYFQTFGSHQSGVGCPQCARNQKLTIKEAEKRCSDLVKGQKWTGNSGLYWFNCNIHGRYKQTYGNHCYGDGSSKKGCIKCKSFKSENDDWCASLGDCFVANYLSDLDVSYHYDGYYNHGTRHRYDFCLFLKGRRIIIEVTNASVKGLSKAPNYWYNLKEKINTARKYGDIVIVLKFWKVDKRYWDNLCDSVLFPVLVKYGIIN